MRLKLQHFPRLRHDTGALEARKRCVFRLERFHFILHSLRLPSAPKGLIPGGMAGADPLGLDAGPRRRPAGVAILLLPVHRVRFYFITFGSILAAGNVLLSNHLHIADESNMMEF